MGFDSLFVSVLCSSRGCQKNIGQGSGVCERSTSSIFMFVVFGRQTYSGESKILLWL